MQRKTIISVCQYEQNEETLPGTIYISSKKICQAQASHKILIINNYN
jgi:hypothetical protein